jgi:site-specific DNA recombinase
LGSQTVLLSLPKNKNMKGIIYVRVSSEEQVKGTSLENQDELCRAYCKSKGIEVLGIYREEGASAKTASAPNFCEPLNSAGRTKARLMLL